MLTSGPNAGSRERARLTRKTLGIHFTPSGVVDSLLSWVLREQRDRLLDLSCGDGRFIARHPNSVGVEYDPIFARLAAERAPAAQVNQGDFFSWANTTTERFHCAVGNPPFIRFQNFRGENRTAASSICRRESVEMSALASAWAPGVDPVSPDSRRLGLGTETQELAW